MEKGAGIIMGRKSGSPWDFRVVPQLWTGFVLSSASALFLLLLSAFVLRSEREHCGTMCHASIWGLVCSIVMLLNLALGSYNYSRACRLQKIASRKGGDDAAEWGDEKSPLTGSGRAAVDVAEQARAASGLRVVVVVENIVSLILMLGLSYFCTLMIVFWTRVKEGEAWLVYVGYVGGLVAAALSQLHCLLSKLKLMRSSKRDRAKVILFGGNLFLLAVGVTMIVVNGLTLDAHANDPKLDRWVFRGMSACGVVCFLSSISGLFITGVTYSRLSNAFLSSTALPLPYLFVEVASLLMNVLFAVSNLWILFLIEVQHTHEDILRTLEVNAGIGFVAVIVTCMIHAAYHHILNPELPSRYTAEEIDIADVPDATLKRWADRITAANGTKHFGAWDGRATVSLMRAFSAMLLGGEHSPIPYARGVCLRVVDRGVQRDAELGGDGAGPDVVGLIFITIVERFDLARYVPGCFGRALSRMFGSFSCIPILSLRWGLVGFQWPFHSGVFMMRRAATDAGRVDEMVQIQRALVRWNDRSDVGCDVLFLPSMVTQAESLAFERSNFLNMPIGPSVVVDLRRYRGASFKEFQRAALKRSDRRNHADYFERKGGSFHVSRDFSQFSDAYPRVVASLTGFTAQQRMQRGELPAFCRITPLAVQTIAERHGREFRRLFGVKVNGVDAGCATMFEFPATRLITSDMQGLRHEVARPSRAYFAMLARTVEIGLREGVDFVDFGPTTIAPKVDVGGRLVQCRAGYHTRMMLMRTLLKQGNDNFQSLQKQMESRYSLAEGERAYAVHESFIASDFQVCTPELFEKFGVLKDSKVVSRLTAADRKSGVPASSTPGVQKKSKKQLNKEKRKAAAKARKAAKARARREREAAARAAKAGGTELVSSAASSQ